MHFDIYREGGGNALGALKIGATTGQWRWRLKAANHETIASVESDANRQDCLRAVELLKNTNMFTPVNVI